MLFCSCKQNTKEFIFHTSPFINSFCSMSLILELMELVGKISTAADKEYTVIIFIELKKTKHLIRLLLNKLERYGLRGVAYKWLRAYLENRHQYVQINNMKSKLLWVTWCPTGASAGSKTVYIIYQ